jgi:hypothetical protein
MDRPKVAPRRQTRQSVKKDHDSHPNTQERQAVKDLEYIKRAGDELTECVPTEEDLMVLADALVYYLINEDYQLRRYFSKSDLPTRAHAKYRLGLILACFPKLKSEIEAKVRRGYRANDVAELIVDMEAEAQQCDETETNTRLQ